VVNHAKMCFPIDAGHTKKIIELQVEPYSEERVRDMCKKLLANPVIEDYRFEVAQ